MNLKKQSRRNFVKSAVGVFGAAPFFSVKATAANLNNRSFQHQLELLALINRPPPIVIKSGSLIIESDVEFDRDGNRAIYEGQISSNVPPLQSILVNRINLQTPGRDESVFFVNPSGHEIRIWLQAFVGQPGRTDEWVPPSTSFPPDPDVLIRNQPERNQNKIVVTLPTDDTDKDVDRKKRHPVRNNRLILLKTLVENRTTRQESRIFRFGKVVIADGNNRIVYESQLVVDGDEFVISAWNEILPVGATQTS